MIATSPLDARILRALRSRPTHAYSLVAALGEDAPNRATVYRRLDKLERDGLLLSSAAEGRGPTRRVYKLSAAGQAALRDELRAALDLLSQAFHDRATRRGGGSWPAAPIVMVSGARVGGVELRILAAMARAKPRQVHLVVPAGVAARTDLPVMDGSFFALPFRDGYARTLFVNELPPARSLRRAVDEWARVLHAGGVMHAIAPAPLPRGADPFVDFLAQLQEELFPDVAATPATDVVTRALAVRFGSVSVEKEGGQRVWTASRAK